MSNTRTIFDKDVAELHDYSVRNRNDYVMNLISAENANMCYYQGGARNGPSELRRPMNQQGFLDFGAKADLETRLQNRHLPLGSFDRTNQDYKDIETQLPPQCQNVKEHLVLDESRLSHPLQNYREMRTDEYNFVPYLHMNPQDVMVTNTNWHGNEDRNGISSRISLKSNKYTKPMEYKDLVAGIAPPKSQ